MKLKQNKFDKKLFIAYIFYLLSGFLGAHWLFLKKPERALTYILLYWLIIIFPFLYYSINIYPFILPDLSSLYFVSLLFPLYMWIKDYKKIPAEIDRVKQKASDVYRVHFNMQNYILTIVYVSLMTILLFTILLMLYLTNESVVDYKKSSYLYHRLLYLFIDFERPEVFLLPSILVTIFIILISLGLFGILIVMVLNIVEKKHKHISKYIGYIDNVSKFLLALSVSTWPTPVIIALFSLTIEESLFKQGLLNFL